MNLLQNYITDLKKKDTILAFLVSSILHYFEHKNMKQSILFSIKFVLIFLLFLNLLF
jgi:hypothetical protein